jgi:acetoin utilization deacetylase AcuC-like enzyme
VIPVVWSEQEARHDPRAEIWVGVRTPAAEVAERALAIRAALASAGHPELPARPQPDEALLTVHDVALVEFLRTAWAAWEEAGLPADPGQDRVVPYIFPHPGLTSSPCEPVATWARTGMYCFDTMTLIGPGTWEAARGAADAALTAADLVAAREARTAYACTRPPGHHATRTAYGGSCYLNNTALAAARLREALDGPVAVVDVDAHHGNGAQAIFAERTDVLTASVHVDPAAGWFPHFLGHAVETCGGTNRNLPLAPGSGDREWLAAVQEAARWASGPAPVALVVALGVDAAADDPESPLDVTEDGYREAGRVLGALGLPTVIVQEGGYALETIGALVRATLNGFEEAPHG